MVKKKFKLNSSPYHRNTNIAVLDEKTNACNPHIDKITKTIFVSLFEYSLRSVKSTKCWVDSHQGGANLRNHNRQHHAGNPNPIDHANYLSLFLLLLMYLFFE